MRNRGGNNGFLYRTIALGEVLKIKVVKGVTNPNPVVVNNEKKTEVGSEKKEPGSEKKEQGEEKKAQEEEKK